MKLRDKKTGEIENVCLVMDKNKIAVVVANMPLCGNSVLGEYNTLAELNEEWGDYTPAEPLIKDEKIRKAVRAWAEMHNIKKVFYCKYSWKNNIAWLEDAENDQSMVKGESVSIDIPIIGLKNREYYTIAELCGEEEE